MVIAAENLRAAIDSVLICTFASQVLTEAWMVPLVQAVMGVDLEIDACGARICNLERGLALREGISTRDDQLPSRILEEPLCGGDYDGVWIGRHNFDRMLAEYYARRGWDTAGIPAEMTDPSRSRVV